MVEIVFVSFCDWGLPENILLRRRSPRARIIYRRCDFQEVFELPVPLTVMTAALTARDFHEFENFDNVFLQARIGTYWIKDGETDQRMKLPDPEDFGLTALEVSR